MRYRLLILTWLQLACAHVAANDGALDPSFGSNGVAKSLAANTAAGSSSGPAVQTDGKIVTCGTSAGSASNDMAIFRFTADGLFDASFGNQYTLIDFGAADTCVAVAVQADGKIVVAGSATIFNNTDFAVARLNSDHTLDTAFGGGTGKKTIAFDAGGDNYDSVAALALQADGKIVLVGQVRTAPGNTDFGFVRLLGDGSLDTTFNGTGKQTVAFDFAESTSKGDYASSVAIDSQSRILAAGVADRGTHGGDFAVVRLLANGQLDPAFDADGRASIAFDLGGAAGSNDDAATAIVLRGDEIVLAGAVDASASASGSNYDMAAASLNSDGSLDTGFGSGGRVRVPFDLVANGFDAAYGLAKQSDGKLVLVGYVQDSSNYSAAIVRLNADGTLDNQFGQSGKATYALPLTYSQSSFAGVGFQGGQIIVSGTAHIGGHEVVIVERLQNDLIFADQFE